MINAAKTNNITELQRLIDTGANINSTDSDGWAALIWAAYNGHLETAQCLVTAGAELEAKEEYGMTALMWAAENGRLETAQFLLTAGAELEDKANDGMTALILAAHNGHVETAQCLVTAGADLTASTNNDTTALSCAAYERKIETAQYLVYSGKPWFRSILPLQNYDAAIAELEQYSRRARYASKTGEILTGVRDNIASLKAMLLGGGGAEPAPAVVKYPRRINLLAAKICGVVFPANFTQNLSGITLSKFNHIVSLMRAAKTSQLMHGVNCYFFTRIFMLESSTVSILEKIPFDVKSNLLGFVLGKEETKTLMRELQAIRMSDMTPAAGSAASWRASEPERRKITRLQRDYKGL